GSPPCPRPPPPAHPPRATPATPRPATRRPPPPAGATARGDGERWFRTTSPAACPPRHRTVKRPPLVRSPAFRRKDFDLLELPLQKGTTKPPSHPRCHSGRSPVQPKARPPSTSTSPSPTTSS